MNQYAITLINKNNIERTVKIEAVSEAAAVTSDSFKKQFQKGESIKGVSIVSGLRNFELIIRDFKGGLYSKRVKALSVQDALNKVENELFFGSGKVVEVHELKRSADNG